MEEKKKSLRFRPSLRQNFFVKRPEFHRKELGKFSTSDPNDDVASEPQAELSQTIPSLDQAERIERQVEDSRPNINIAVINSIFEAKRCNLPKDTEPEFRQQTIIQIADNVAQRAVNDCIVEKLKSKLKSKQSGSASECSEQLVCCLYQDFIREFDLSQFCRLFKCLNTVKTIRLDKGYVINAVQQSFRSQKELPSQQLEFLSELQLKRQLQRCCNDHIGAVQQEMYDLIAKETKIKEYIQTHRLSQSQKIEVARQLRLFEQERTRLSARLIREQEKGKRLTLELAEIKEKLKAKIEWILRSNTYFEAGYGQLYGQIRQAEVDVSPSILESLLDQADIAFLQKRTELERQILVKQKGFDTGQQQGIASQVQSQLREQELKRLRNELIILQETMVERIGRLPHKEKHVRSLFGTGRKGQGILSKLGVSTNSRKLIR